MTYNPNIPQSTDLISNSQSQILGNFDQLNAQFGIDHVAFNTGSGNGSGFHNKVTFVSNISTPSITGAVSAIYPKVVSAVAEAYFVNGVGDSVLWRGGSGSGIPALTQPASTPSIGQMTLPNGFMFIWGYINTPVNGMTYTIGSAGFPNTCSNIQMTGQSTIATATPITLQLLSPTQFKYLYGGSSITRIYYFAIGY
jgi:hypothetical protein